MCMRDIVVYGRRTARSTQTVAVTYPGDKAAPHPSGSRVPNRDQPN
jgi:hypothetical protein